MDNRWRSLATAENPLIHFISSCLARGSFAGAAALLCTPACAQTEESFDWDWRIYPQFTAEWTDTTDGISFGTDHIRARIEAASDRWLGAAQLDFGVDNPGDNKPGALANVVADVYVNYQATSTHVLRFGQYKTPIGMDYNIPLYRLDLTERGMEAGLVLNRDLGFMVSARDIGDGFGYDVGVFNPPGRSRATAYEESQVGEDNAVVARAHYDAGNWHAEFAHGVAPNAGGPISQDYRVSDFGFRYFGEGWNTKFEVVEGHHVRGISGFTERVYYMQGAYALNPRLELIVRHYAGTSELAGATTSLTNTYFGMTLKAFEHEHFEGRLQVNLIAVGGDETAYSGVRGRRSDALMVQFQLYADK